MTTRLIIDLPTSRVRWFTQDDSVELQPEGGSVLVYHDGELPEGLTTANSWKYKYKNQKFISPKESIVEVPTLLDLNKAEVVKLLKSKLFELRAMFGPQDLYALECRNVKRAQALKILNGEPYDQGFVDALSEGNTPEGRATAFANFIMKEEDRCQRLHIMCEVFYRTYLTRIENCMDSNLVVAMYTQIEAEAEHLRMHIIS